MKTVKQRKPCVFKQHLKAQSDSAGCCGEGATPCFRAVLNCSAGFQLRTRRSGNPGLLVKVLPVCHVFPCSATVYFAELFCKHQLKFSAEVVQPHTLPWVWGCWCTMLTFSWHGGKPDVAAVCACSWSWGNPMCLIFSSMIAVRLWWWSVSLGQAMGGRQGRQNLRAVSGLVLQCRFFMIIKQKSFLLSQWYRHLFFFTVVVILKNLHIYWGN